MGTNGLDPALLNTVHCMDCLEFMKTLPDRCIDLVLTDPPYEFISKNPTGGGIYKNDNKKHLVALNESFGMTFDPTLFLKEIKRVTKNFNAYIWTNKSLLKDYIQFAEDNGYKWDLLIRIKNNPVPAFNGKYMNDKEYCVYIKEPGAVFNTLKGGFDKYFTYYKDSIGNGDFDHPTIKPIHMIQTQLDISSNKGDIVLDCFAGSGTTGVACKELGRNYILVEKEPKYVDIIHKRLQNTTISLFHS